MKQLHGDYQQTNTGKEEYKPIVKSIGWLLANPSISWFAWWHTRESLVAVQRGLRQSSSLR